MLEALRRDLRTVANDILGRRTPPFLSRAPLGRHQHVIDPLGGRSLRVARVVRETRDAVTLHFESPEPIAFRPGQFLTLLVDIGGETLRRAYSICTSPRDGHLAVTVKRVEGGRVSNHLVDDAKEGDVLRVLGPSGNFGVAPDPSERRRLLLVAGGSGITPIYSIAKSVLEVEPESEITLVYGNRSKKHVIFREGLEQLARAHAGRFEVRHVIGMLDAKELLPLVDDRTEVFVCGPQPMMDLVRTTLGSVPKERLHEERFSSPSLSVTRPTAPQAVEVKMRGGARSLVVMPEQTILESALQAGVPLPFSCGMGGCGACKVKLVEGDVAIDEPNCLTAEEREQGYVLTCASRACSNVVLSVEEPS